MKQGIKNLLIAAGAGVFAALFGMMPLLTLASSIEFLPSNGNFKSDTQVPVNVLIDTGAEKINALSGEIVLPRNVAVEVSDGNSIVSNWIIAPAVENNRVKFSGIIPGGYSGHDGILLTLLISSSTGTVPLNFVALPQVLLHDGLGTKDKVAISAAALHFSPNGQTITLPVDDDAPEPFTVMIIRDQALHEDKYVALFATQDKGSGIDHYEVMEVKSYNENSWQRAESPYVLKDQSRSSYIYVKAVDRAGNEQIASVGPAYEVPLVQRMIWPLILLLLIVAAFTIWRILSHRQMIKSHLKKKQTA